MKHEMCSRIGIGSIIVLVYGVGTAFAAGPIDVGSRKQLFVDDKFIARSQGVELTMNVPVKMNQPVLASDIPWEGEPGAAAFWYSSVIKEGDRIRIWGSGKAMLPVRMEPDGPVVNLFAYALSQEAP